MSAILQHRRKAFRAAGGGDSPTTANLVGWWKMDDSSGGFADAHTTGHTATANGAGLNYAQTGKNGDAVLFDNAGSDEYGLFQEATVFGITDYPFTYGCWVKDPDDGELQTILSIASSASTSIYWGIRFNSDVLNIYCRNSGAFLSAVGTTDFTGDTDWHQLTAVFASATDRRLYLDGTLEAGSASETSKTYNSAANSFAIGRLNSSSPGGYLSGTVDDVFVFDDELTTAEITWLQTNSFDDL